MAENIPLMVGSEVDLWNKLMKEVKLGRVAGPFDEIPFEHFIQSLIGLVPKAGTDQTHLVFHLSYDFKREGLQSVNHFTPKEKCSVKYRDLDFVVKNLPGLNVIVCPSVRLGLTMVKFSYSLVRHHETAMYMVK